MFKNQLKVAWRYLIKNKGYSFIYIAGLAVGMAVSLIDALWIYDETSYNKSHENYDRIAMVMLHTVYSGGENTIPWTPSPVGNTLKKDFPNDFKRIVTSSIPSAHVLSFNETNISKDGSFMQPAAPDMLTLNMIKGTRSGLLDPYSILICESVANIFFPNTDPINKVIKLDNQENVKVTGVYQDQPDNSDFKNLAFILPWDLFLSRIGLGSRIPESWTNNSYYTYVELADKSNIEKVSLKIKEVVTNNLDQARDNNLAVKLELLLHPMRKWHLYSEFKDGVSVGGKIEFVRLFLTIGAFVLLLACINFINLSTARSQIRAKEIGIRKTIGSNRWRLIIQFFRETFLIILFSYLIALGLVIVLLPFFNQIADKKLTIFWGNGWFWLLNIAFCLLTCFLAGIYPAFFLSSFKPVQVLKGSLKIGGLATLQRKILIVVQFTVSIVLIIGTMVVYRQIQYAKNRPIGYSKKDLITIRISSDIDKNFEIISDELRKTNAVADIAKSLNTTTEYFVITSKLKWEGKGTQVVMPFVLDNISNNYGKTIGWEIKRGRDFSSDLLSDSASCILNESAAKAIGSAGEIGKLIEFQKNTYSVIGVVNDMLVESPYKGAMPTAFFMTEKLGYLTLIIKLKGRAAVSTEIAKIATVFKKFDPSVPFDYQFVDEEYAKKFNDEVRIGKISFLFTILAIFISCLGLYGLSAFFVQQRAKEFGIRKVLGASILSIWKLLTIDFITLIIISLFISIPLSYYFMYNWLQDYAFRTKMPWYLFAIAGLLALVITLFVVSSQAIKAGFAKPVSSLRTE